LDPKGGERHSRRTNQISERDGSPCRCGGGSKGGDSLGQGKGANEMQEGRLQMGDLALITVSKEGTGERNEKKKTYTGGEEFTGSLG